MISYFVTTTLTVLLIILIRYLYYSLRRPKNFPPGPEWLPIVGSASLLKSLSKQLGGQHNALCHLAAKYQSPIIGFKIGAGYYVAVFSEELIRQVFTREEFQARPDNYFIKLRSMGTNKGITMTNGSLWQEQRAFAFRHLRDLGFGKTHMQTLIVCELKEMLRDLEGHVNLTALLAPRVVNVLWAMMAGSHFPVSERPLLTLMEERLAAFDMVGGILGYMPWLRHFAPQLTGYTLIQKINAEIKQLLLDTISYHKKTFVQGEIRDFIDAFLQEMKNSKGTESTFSEDQLMMVCLDFFIAGSSTTSNTLGFAFLAMLIYPDIQVKVQNELNSVLLPGQLPTMNEKRKLPYTEAVLLETERYMHVVPIAGPRRVLENTELGGYSIPQGTTVLLSLKSLHHDSRIWSDPSVFKPERFLDCNGSSISGERLVRFGLGKRRCPGEALAKTFIFTFFAGLLHLYRLAPPEGYEPQWRIIPGITLAPEPFCVRLIPL